MSAFRTPLQHFPVHLVHPRYWGAWLAFGLLWSLGQLPWSLQLLLGRGLGLLAWRFARTRRHFVRTNMRLAFPELSPEAQQAMAQRCVQEAGIGLMESAGALWGRADRYDALAHYEGFEHLQTALAGGKGVLLVGMHMHCLDIAGRLLTRELARGDLAASVIFQSNPNAVWAAAMNRARGSFFQRLIDRSDLRGLLRALKNNEIIWYAPDQDFGRKQAVFAPFFGVPTATITATARLAKLSGAAVVGISYRRLPDNQGYCVRIHPPFAAYPSGDDLQDATTINAFIEAAVREAPEQYMWVHRRFKTRPEGDEHLYGRMKPHRARRIARARLASAELARTEQKQDK